MRQLNKDAVYEVEQINQQITYLESSLLERKDKLAMLNSGMPVGRNQEADELMNELENEKRDQDNR